MSPASLENLAHKIASVHGYCLAPFYPFPGVYGVSEFDWEGLPEDTDDLGLTSRRFFRLLAVYAVEQTRAISSSTEAVERLALLLGLVHLKALQPFYQENFDPRTATEGRFGPLSEEGLAQWEALPEEPPTPDEIGRSFFRAIARSLMVEFPELRGPSD